MSVERLEKGEDNAAHGGYCTMLYKALLSTGWAMFVSLLQKRTTKMLLLAAIGNSFLTMPYYACTAG